MKSLFRTKEEIRRFYEDRYAQKIKGILPRLVLIRSIDNSYYQNCANQFLSGKNEGYVVNVGAGVSTIQIPHGWQLMSLDISYNALSVNQSKCLRVVGDAAAMPFAIRSVDLIYCIEVLEHLPANDDVRAISEMQNILKVGGVLVISTPNEIENTSFIFRLLNGLFDDSGHFRSYTEVQLAKILTKNGFEVIDRGTCGFFILSLLLVVERSACLSKINKKIKISQHVKKKIYNALCKLLKFESSFMRIFFKGFRSYVIAKKLM